MGNDEYCLSSTMLDLIVQSILGYLFVFRSLIAVIESFDIGVDVSGVSFSQDQLFGSDKSRVSNSELRYHKLVSKAFDGLANVNVSFNEQLVGYEADIVLRVGSAVINVEVDGPFHKQAVKQRFCYWRDRYLTERQGVTMKRFDLMCADENSLSDEDIINRFRQMV
jgi:hypothetical protein